MAYDVEDKVVQMRFDNREFDPNIDASIRSLEKLEKSLSLANGTEGFKDVNKAISKMDFSPAITAVESLSNKFSTMEIVAISAISNISNRLTNMALGVLKQLFVTPIYSGWEEYGMQLDSTQVIMANTGDEIGKVTDALDRLNEYADLTVYSFGQMTQAIGKFAAASVDLDSSVAAIKGLSNAAALVGANNQQLFSAYYNLSQALQLGALTAIDWRPLQMTQIGTKTMQKVFIETAISMGRFTRDSEQAQKAFSDFKGSLSSKWLDKEVVVNALKVYSLNIEELTKQVDAATGEVYYLNKEGEKIPEWMAKLGTSATKAATEIKNLKQLWDVLKEEAQTGWADNWKIIVGDLNEAKELWTNVGNRITSILHTINGAIKDIVQSWRDNGGRDTFISFLEKSLDNLRIGLSVFFKVLDRIIPLTNDTIVNFTKRLNDMAEALHLDAEQADSLYNVLTVLTLPLQIIARVLMAIYNIGYFVISSVIEGVKIVLDIISALKNNITLILDIFGITKDKILNIISVILNFRNIVINIISMIASFALHSLKLILPVIISLGKVIFSVLSIIFNTFKKLSETDIDWFANILNILYNALELVANIIVIIANVVNEALDNGLGDFIVSVVGIVGTLINFLSKLATIIVYIVSNVLEKVVPLLGSIGRLLLAITNLIVRLLSSILNINASNLNEFLDAFVDKLAIGIDKIGSFINGIANFINGLADKINNSSLLEVGSWIVNSLLNGIGKVVPLLFSTLLSIGNTIIETIRNILQIHSESPLFFGIGMWIPQSIANGEEQGIPIVQNASERLSDAIFGVFVNNPQQIEAQKQIDSWNSAITNMVNGFNEKYRHVFRFVIALVALVGSFTILYFALKKIPSVGEVFEAIGDIGASFKWKAIGATLKSFGATILMLVGSLVLLRIAFENIETSSFSRIIIMLSVMITAIMSFMVIASNISKNMELLEISKFTAVVGIIQTLISSMALMAFALSFLKNAKVDSSVIETLFVMFTAIDILVLIASRLSKNSNNVFNSLVGIAAIETLIFTMTFLIISLNTLSRRNFNNKGINKILFGITAAISTLALVSKILTGRTLDETKVAKAVIGIAVIDSLILSLVPLIVSINTLGNKWFNWKSVTIILGSITGVISVLSLLTKAILKDYSDIGKTIVGVAVIDNFIMALIPLIMSMTILQGKTIDWQSVGITLAEITGVITALSLLTKIIVMKYNNIGKSIAGLVVIRSMINGLIPLIGSIALLNQARVSKDTVNIFAKISGIIAVLSIIVAKLIVTDYDDIGKAIFNILAFQAITVSIISLMASLQLLNNAYISDDTIAALFIVSNIILGLTAVVSRIVVTNYKNIGKAMVGILAFQLMTADIIVLMHYLERLNNANISYDTIAKLFLLSNIIAGLTAIGSLIGRGMQYTAIGAAAIVAISAALLIAAEALNKFSAANMNNLNNGFERFRDILAGSWGNFAKTVGALLALSALVPILSLLAPAVDIIAIGIWLMSVAMLNASNAIHTFMTDIESLFRTITGSLIYSEEIAEVINSLGNNLGDIGNGIKDVAGGIALIGAALAAAAVGFSLLLPFTFLFVNFLKQIGNVFDNFISNIDKLSDSITKLANNAESIDKLLSTLETHIKGFKVLISSIFVGGFIDKGKSFRRIIISLAQAFTIASFGLVNFGLGIGAIGKGLLWLTVGFTVAKAVLGEELNNLLTRIRNNITSLIDKFGELRTSIILMSRISSIISAISGLAMWLGYIGKQLKSFGSGLIRTAIGAMLFSFAMKKVAEGLLYIQQNNPAAVIGGIYSVVLALSSISIILGPLSPLMKEAAGGIALLSLSILMLSGSLATLSLVLNVISTMWASVWELYGFITVFTVTLGLLTPLAILAGVGIGTLGAGLIALDAGLLGLVGVIALLNSTTGGMSGLWEMYGFITAFAATLGTLAIPAFLAGIGIGTLGAGLIALAAGLAAIVGVMALFSKVVSESELLQNIFTSISNTIIIFKNGLAQMLVSVASFFSNIFPSIKDQVISNFESIGWWIPESIKNGIESAINTVFDAATNVANKIESTIRNILDIHSESPKLFDLGTWIPKSIADGMNSASQTVVNSAKKVATSLWDTIDKVTNGRAKQSLNNIKNKLGNLKNTLSNLFNFKNKNGLFGGIADKLSNLDFGKWLDVDAIKFDKVDFGNAADGLNNMASGIGNVGSAAQTTKGTIEELTDTIRNQMKVFERFNDEGIINPKELIHNMESQVRGITNWANGLDVLAMRGMSAELMQYLAEMGPEGYKYVESFLEMTESEFQHANAIFAQSVTLPESAANTIRHGYEIAGVDIVEAVTNAANGAADGVSNAFDGVKTEIIEGSTEIGKKVASEAMEKGELTATTIRELAGEAGRAGELYFAPELNRWLSSTEFEEMKDKLQSVYKFNAGDLMDQFAKASPTNKVDTSKTIFDHDYLSKIAKSDGVFYLDGFGEALSSSQYIAKCMEKGGQLLPAVIDESVKPADLGDKMGKTSIEWACMSIEDGSTDLADSMENSWTDAVDESSGGIWDVIESFVDSLCNNEAELYEDTLTSKLKTATYNSWNEAMNDSDSYKNKMQKEYDEMIRRQKENQKNLSDGLKGNTNSYSKTGKNDAKSYISGFDNEAKINSPSEVMSERGQYLIEGLANGIDKYMYMVTNASEELANNPINAIADTITQISSLFTEDLDAAPTITPILDMSNVESGASELDTLFSTQQAQIAANANVRYTHDDSVNRLKAAYADVLSKSNAELINAIQNTEQPINVNVVLQGDASTFFSAMVDQTRSTVASGGMNPFLITNRNSINAALV